MIIWTLYNNDIFDIFFQAYAGSGVGFARGMLAHRLLFQRLLFGGVDAPFVAQGLLCGEIRPVETRSVSR